MAPLGPIVATPVMLGFSEHVCATAGELSSFKVGIDNSFLFVAILYSFPTFCGFS